MGTPEFVLIPFIFLGFVGIKCVKYEIQETSGTVEYFFEFGKDFKCEFTEKCENSYEFLDVTKNNVESYEKRNPFDNVPRRKRSFLRPRKNTRLMNNLSFYSYCTIGIKKCDDEEGPVEKSCFERYCDICKIYFRHDTTYEKHFVGKHPNNNPYPCPYCDSSHLSRKNSVRHMQRCHPKKLHKISVRSKNERMTCELCITEHKGVKALERHSLKAHEGVKTKKCSDCHLSFFRINELKRHRVNKHQNQATSNADPFRCTFCDNVFKASDLLDGHKAACQKKQEMKKRGSIQADARTLEILKDRTLCKKCGVKFQSLSELKEHTRVHHPETKGIFSCDRCKKTFIRGEALEKHNDKFHPDLEGIDPKKKYYRGATFTCPACGKEFSGVLLYQTHFKTFHPDGKPFRCVTCGTGLASKSGLRQHLRCVHGTDVFLCTYCAKSFALEKDLRKHEKTCGKTNSHKKEYFCDICMKWLKGSLETHLSNHDDFDYCEYCDLRFHKKRNPAGLSEHLFRRHRNEFSESGSLNVAEMVESYDHKIKQGNREIGEN